MSYRNRKENLILIWTIYFFDHRASYYVRTIIMFMWKIKLFYMEYSIDKNIMSSAI